MHNFKAIILAGGSGERFWPLSTPEKPKQFLRVFGGESLIRQSVSRLKGLVKPKDVFVITSKALVAATRKELPEIPKANIIGEPMRRDTGAAIPSVDGRGEQKFQGQPVKVKLEETALKAIAEASKGRYVPLATAGTAETTLGAIYRRFLRQVAAKEQNEEAERAAERFQIFLVPGLVLLIAGAMLSKGRFARRK